MLTIRRILFPTDFSACARGAHDHALYLAARYGAELHILHVLVTDTFVLDDIGLKEADIAEQLRLSTADDLDTLEAVRPKGEPHIVTAQVHAPSAPVEIVHYAEAHDVDLIVMGTRGRRGLERLLMGSTAEQVVRLAPCPVLTVCKKHAVRRQPLPRFLVPVDFSALSMEGLRYAAALAQTYDAVLDVIHVVERRDVPAFYFGGDRGSGYAEDVEVQAADRLAEFARGVVPEDVSVTYHVASGHPVEAILDEIEELGDGLVVIPTHGRTGLHRLLMGSVAEQVVRLAPCPVFTVKSFGRSLVAEAESHADVMTA